MQSAWPLPLSPAQQQELEAAYRSPPRAYHHFGHVQALLRHFEDVARGPGWERPAETWLAILFHDAIYRPGRGDNEQRSAALAAETIPRWWPNAGLDVDRVEQLILLTARHGQLQAEQVDRDAALFLDCDMAILGAPAEAFDAYDRGIAEEYRGHVPGFLFRINRRRFLQGVLAQRRIFLSDFFHDRYDAPARANLRRATAR
ncbi:MAG TPA: hypothetical protein DDZ67_13090 [Xanthomonadaceae bacterium]|nr:hypothetical protein [Xanthomonadaceae bacterium]